MPGICRHGRRLRRTAWLAFAAGRRFCAPHLFARRQPKREQSASLIWIQVQSVPLRQGRIGSNAFDLQIGDRDVHLFAISRRAPLNPPSFPPWPTRVCQRISPRLSGSNPCATPDFWPITSALRPFASETRIGGCPKSESGPSAGNSFSREYRNSC
jgi:hypothetical protein